MKRSLLAIGFFSLASGAWSQTSVITSVLNNLGQPRLSPGDAAQIYGIFPMGRRTDFTVTVGSLPASILLVANDVKLNRGFQLDIQVPTELPPGGASVVVFHSGDGITSPGFPVTISPLDPVINADPFSAFLHTAGVSVQPDRPASPGETITTFMTGLGATNPVVPTGTDPATFTPTTIPITVTVGGMSAPVTFAGRYPTASIFPSLVGYQVTFTVPSSAPGGPNPVVVTIGGVSGNTQTLFTGTEPLPSPPVIAKVVSGATFLDSTPISPGSFVTIFGTGFGNVDNLSAFPATEVNGISVLFNGQPAPIFSLAASAGQINVLTPSDLPSPGETVHGVAVSVQNKNGPSKASFITPAAAGPAMFSVHDPSNASRHNVAALLANTAWYVMPDSQALALGLTSCSGLAVTARCGQPATRGDFVQLYATGLGITTPGGDPGGAPLATGQAAPASGNPFYATVAKAIVTVGGQPANVIFSGLAPGYAGLYQVNFQIPASSPVGDNVPITISVPGSTTDSATLAIR